MTMPCGKYYVGDLYYVMSDRWDEVCDFMFPNNSTGEVNGEFILKDGTKFANYFTKYGDGEYYDDYGNAYPVESGSIGCIKIEDIKDKSALKRLGKQFIFDTDVTTGSKDGKIFFGNIYIDTECE